MSWLSRITSGLKKTATNISEGLKAAVGLSHRLDAQTREALEEVLLAADAGMPATVDVLEALPKKGLPDPLTEKGLKEALASVVEERLHALEQPLALAHKPTVVLLAGVNGSGKTTTIGKLAAQWAAADKKVLVAAADTFRAAAVEQLQVWTERAQVEILPPAKAGADPAGVAYAAVEKAQKEGADVVLIDTAGRLPNRADLLAELAKIARVVKKLDETAPHATLLVLDATLGQSTLTQVREFGAVTPVTGLVVTKLDGTARAGFLLALAKSFPLPVHYVGFGEGLEDIGPFNARAFSRALVGLAQG